MKEYKVEALIYYSKLTLDSEHIAKNPRKKFKKSLTNIREMGTG